MLKPTERMKEVEKDVSKYSIVLAIAKRAREIAEEYEQNGDQLTEKAVDLAVQELYDGKFKIIEAEDLYE